MQMRQITIQLKDAEEENLIVSLLKKMKISFSREEEDDFELTDEMKRVIDSRLQKDRYSAVDARQGVREIRAKYGL